MGGLGQEDSGFKGRGGGVGGLDAPWRCHLLTCSLRLTGPLSRPPQLLRMFFRQQDEIRRLKEELAQKDIRIRQLQLELKNLRNSPKNC